MTGVLEALGKPRAELAPQGAGQARYTASPCALAPTGREPTRGRCRALQRNAGRSRVQREPYGKRFTRALGRPRAELAPQGTLKRAWASATKNIGRGGAQRVLALKTEI